LYRRLGGPQGQYGWVHKILPPPDLIPGPSNLQQVAILTELSQPMLLWLGKHFHGIQNNNMEVMQKVSPTFVGLKADQCSTGASHMKLNTDTAEY